jgi:hypothetical protein
MPDDLKRIELEPINLAAFLVAGVLTLGIEVVRAPGRQELCTQMLLPLSCRDTLSRS